MQPRTHGVGRDLTGARNLVVTQPGGLAQEKHVSIQILERRQRLSDGRGRFLRGPPSRIHVELHELNRGRPPPPIARVIQREIPRDVEHPRPPLGRLIGALRRPRDPQKHLLREIARVLGMADHAAQVPEHAVPMLEEERGAVGHQETLDQRTPKGRDPLTPPPFG